MDLTAVRSVIAIAAGSVTPTLNTYAYVPDSVSEPCFYVGGVEISYDLSMGRGCDEITFLCPVLISSTSDKSGQAELDAYLKGSGAGSLKTAIEAALETAGYSAQVARAQNYGYHEVGGVKYLGAELAIIVSGSGA
ncbi:hypothetical protein V6U81_04390 [Micromonospora sp. CPCC 205711]|uniref:hypothetical protein n=1 Tax=Micromonospora sp. CPCC 205547 TaxID=3122400 RepID=UPI002FF346E9